MTNETTGVYGTPIDSSTANDQFDSQRDSYPDPIPDKRGLPRLVTDGGAPKPAIGDRVTYYDTEGDPRRAIVVDDCPDAEYVTVCFGEQGELGKEYNHSVESASSVFPHADLNEEYTATAIAFKPGWDDA